MKKFVVFIFLFLLFFSVGIFFAETPETELLKAFSVTEQDNTVINITNIASKKLNIIFEANSPDEAEQMQADFPLNNKFDSIKDSLKIYQNYPINFITEHSRSLIKQKKYNELKNEGLSRVYNPLLITVSPPDKDPYLFGTEFIISALCSQDNEIKEFEGKYYTKTTLDIENNNEIENILKNQKKGIFISGSPLHKYIMTKKSAIEINIICIISAIALLLLCKFYFNSYKVFVPIISSIIFGICFGWTTSSIIFKKIHILTFVFSTSLIGISLDYAIHYLVSDKSNSFRKNLTASMLTTVLAFATLIFSGVYLLKQIAVFTIFGLLGVYIFVLTIFPIFFDSIQAKSIQIIDFKKYRNFIISALCMVIAAGCFHFKFNDNIKTLYTPPKNLVKAEDIYQKVFNPKTLFFLTISGNSVDERLEKEEKLNLKNKIGLSDFISSKSRQNENIKLVKELYKNNLNNYAVFLPETVRNSLNHTEYEIYNPENFPLSPFFKSDNTHSFVITDSQAKGAINPANEISKMLKQTRKKCLKIFPIIFVVLFIFLSIIYGFKQGLKIIAAPIIGAICAILFTCAIGHDITLFSVLGIFLIIGFGIDYSIFGMNKDKKTSDAILISACSTALSFLMLSFTSFNIISTLGLILFLGICFAYLISKITE